MVQIPLLYEKTIITPKYKYFPFIWYKSVKVSTIVQGVFNYYDIIHIEELTDDEGKIYEDCCAMTVKDVGRVCTALTFDELNNFVQPPVIGFNNEEEITED